MTGMRKDGQPSGQCGEPAQDSVLPADGRYFHAGLFQRQPGMRGTGFAHHSEAPESVRAK